MVAVTARQLSHRRYRRRIIGWGAVGLLAIFTIGAIVSEPKVEDDLEGRVVRALDDAGVGPVTVKFVGQDGTLRCDQGPVAIPGALVTSAREIWGVRTIEVAANCTSVLPATTNPTTSSPPNTTIPVTTEPPASTATDVANELDDVGTLLDLIANDSEFSTLKGLISDADLDGRLSGADPLTMFAPTNAAFQALGPDVVAALGRDVALLRVVLLHHVTAGDVTVSAMSTGPIDMLDGSPIDVTIDGDVALTSLDSTAIITEADLTASNGIVHAIDHVLLPAAATETAPAVGDSVSATWENGQITLSGMVGTAAQRDQAVAAATSRLDPANVIDELVIDEATVLDDQRLGGFFRLIATMPSTMSAGVATITSEAYTLAGTTLGPEAELAVEAVVGEVGDVVTDLQERPNATEQDAAELATSLNALVATRPILFEPNSSTITADSAAVLDQVAALANRVGGISIEIQGHTDTDGLAATNQALSVGRAAAVRDALVARAVAASSLTSTGFGGTRPILDAAGVEDKVASRRVEFAVTLQS